jgi:rare lipoprotein A
LALDVAAPDPRGVLVRSWITASIAIACAAGCASAGASVEGARPADTAGWPAQGVERGLASYYADTLAGRPTASGEPYDPLALTAAHRRLPLGTWIEVARDDGRRVVVRVNDRGPYAGERRIVDLSRSAAAAIGLLREGVAPVTLRVVRAAPARSRAR